MGRTDLLVMRTAIAAALALGFMAAPQAQPAPAPGSGQSGASVPGGSGITPIGVGSNPTGRRYEINPGIRASVLASDNLDLQPRGAEQSGTLFELAPYIRATLNSPRAVADATYTLRGQVFEGGIDPRNEVRHDLRAWGDMKLSDDAFRLFARANVFDVNISPFGAASFDPGVQRTNRTQYKEFELSPYLFGRLEGDGGYTARYRLRYTDPGGSFSSNTVNAVSGSVRTDLSERRVAGSLRADLYDVDYENGLAYRGADLDLLGWYRVDRTLRVGAGAGYSRNDILLNNKGENDGWGPSVAFEWTPDQRTSVRGRWSDRYYGNNAQVRANHRSANWVLGLDYFTGVNDGNLSGLQGYDTASLFAGQSQAGTPGAIGANPVTQGLADRNLLSGPGTTFGTGVASSPLVYSDRLVASVGWLTTRNFLVASVFVNNRRTAVPFATGVREDTDQIGGRLDFTHNLNQRNLLRAFVGQTVSDSNLSDSQATLSTVGAFWDYRLSARSTTSLGGRVQRQRGTGITVEYDEAAVIASIDYRF
jgi:uncharacterized protein (PEP-CTERM system associated)